jgi:hypothetical protein
VAERSAKKALAVSSFAIAPLDPATYEPHALHREGRAWTESNCYIDVWIEVLHALKCDPIACLPFVIAIDYEGDQWTFFKPPHEDLTRLYGLEVEELNVWRPLIHHVAEFVQDGKLVLTEANSFFLPDTSGTDYRTNHVKTTIGIQAIDVKEQTLGYFHNSSYHALRGDDFVGLFRVGVPHDPAFLPLFAEFVRTARVKPLEEKELTLRSIELLRKHVARAPRTNPATRFKERFPADVEWLKTEGLATYHAHAFATLRQLGAAFEMAALYMRWLEARGERDLLPIAEDFNSISENAKALVLKTARAVNAKRAVDFAPILEAIEQSWARALGALAARYPVK